MCWHQDVGSCLETSPVPTRVFPFSVLCYVNPTNFGIGFLDGPLGCFTRLLPRGSAEPGCNGMSRVPTQCQRGR